MTEYGCEGGRYSNGDEANEVNGGQVHVWQAPDGGLRFCHDYGGDPHDASDEKCHHDEKCLHRAVNGDEICGACLGPDSEVVYGGTCRPGKVNFVGM